MRLQILRQLKAYQACRERVGKSLECKNRAGTDQASKGLASIDRQLRYSLFSLLFLAIAACASQNPEDLKLQPGFSAVKVEGFEFAEQTDAFNLSAYDSFYVSEPSLEFNSYWYKQIKREMSKRDQERITSTYTKVLREKLENKIAKKTGLDFVAEPGPNSLVIEAALTDFRINAPDLDFEPLTKNYVNTAGGTRLTIKLQDPQHHLLARLSDHSETNAAISPNQLKRTNRAANVHDFKILYSRWASRLSDYLIEHEFQNIKKLN